MTETSQLALFKAFWRAAGLDVDPASVIEPDRNSRFPDIVCRIDGVDVGFELTAATSEDAHRHAAPGGAFALWGGAGEIEGQRTGDHEVVVALQSKRGRRYQGAMPVELVVHELLARLDSPAIWLDDFEVEARALVAGSVVRRVWVTSHSGATIFAVYPRVAEVCPPPP